LRDIAAKILEAQRPIRVLRVLSWDDNVERVFFAGKGRELPLHRSRFVTSELALRDLLG